MQAVSVIITVYNGEKYLSECLDSILTQTLEDIEIICVDDASSDDTPQILEKYRGKIHILTNERNCMAGEARNRGFKAARGEYVIFLDADDIFEPDMLEKAYHKAKACMADICIFKEDTFTDDTEKCNNYPYAESVMEALGKRDFFQPLELADMLFNLWNGWAWDKLFRREFIIGTGLQFQNLQSSNDAYFVHSAMASAERISLLNTILVHHRLGNKSSLSNTRDYAWESCLMYLKELKRYLVQNGLYSSFEKSYINWSMRFLYWNYRTLNDRNRSQLTNVLKHFFSEDLTIGQYERAYFFDAFSYWFAHCIVNHEEEKTPLTEEEFFEKVYDLNRDKIENLERYIEKYCWRAALWGAGIRGNAFVRIYGRYWKRLHTVYDMDKTKHGKELYPEIVVKGFDERQEDGADCILVLNSAHLSSVCELVAGKDIMVFDLNTYLTLPYKMEDCIIKCGV